LEKAEKKWRWGFHRWIVLALIILNVVAVNLYAPVQPHIQVAAENIITEPLFTLPVIGDFYLTNSLIATILMYIVIILIALAVRNSWKKNPVAPKGIAGVFEMLVDMIYNMTETTAGKYAAKVFPWFASIVIVLLFANLMKLIPGFESIGVLRHSEHGYESTQALGNGTWSTLLNKEAHNGGYTLVPFLRGVSTDLNFTTALALIAVVMIQVIGVQANGVRYFEKFINVRNIFKKPLFGVIDFYRRSAGTDLGICENPFVHFPVVRQYVFRYGAAGGCGRNDPGLFAIRAHAVRSVHRRNPSARFWYVNHGFHGPGNPGSWS